MYPQHLVDMLHVVKDVTGCDDLAGAADYVLLHYDMYDYKGKDKEFIDMCETFDIEKCPKMRLVNVRYVEEN